MKLSSLLLLCLLNFATMLIMAPRGLIMAPRPSSHLSRTLFLASLRSRTAAVAFLRRPAGDDPPGRISDSFSGAESEVEAALDSALDLQVVKAPRCKAQPVD